MKQINEIDDLTDNENEGEELCEVIDHDDLVQNIETMTDQIHKDLKTNAEELRIEYQMNTTAGNYQTIQTGFNSDITKPENYDKLKQLRDTNK
jgi:hypothetical protein